MKHADEAELQDPSTSAKGGEQGKEVDLALASYCNIDRCNIAPGCPFIARRHRILTDLSLTRAMKLLLPDTSFDEGNLCV
jgi:hypothetical protein